MKILAFALALFGHIAFSQNADMLSRLDFRSIGPANMGGRTTDVEGIPGDPAVMYVGTGSGGAWKTLNGGKTWRALMDRKGTLSVGDMALNPNNPEEIWLGSGEANVRNSVSFGNGVYKSTDGGETWTHLGLKETRHIARVLVHPRDSDTVYVAAVGHIYGPHPERGVFVTKDGGKNWNKTLYIDDQHGASDIDIDPRNPNIVYAGMWKFERKMWTHTSGSENGGLFKSIDGGMTWKKVTNGLPKLVGRIAVKVAPSSPNIVYVAAETNEGVLFRSDDHGQSFRRVSEQQEIISRGFYYTDIRVDPVNPNRVYTLAASMFVSIDGGTTFRRISGSTHSDYHALWIDPKDPRRLWQGQDGGFAVSYDMGENWDPINNIPLGQFYQVFADNALPFYNVSGGLQDNGSWRGPSRTKEGGIVNDHWKMVSFGDGYFTLAHPKDPEWMISESQGGNVVRTHMGRGIQENISPQPRRNDGGPVNQLKYRFNWNTPVVPSPHDDNTVYVGGNVVFRSKDFGSTWEIISPDLTTNDPAKQGEAGGPIWRENTTAEYHCTIISLAESPIKRGVIWSGSDDGKLFVTMDDGRNWTELTVPGVPAHSPVSHVEPSRTDANVCYVAFDRHMFDDYRPYVFKTTDGGRTWRSISGDLPEMAEVWVVKEDPRNTNLLYAGTEIGLYASWETGKWFFLGLSNLPDVSVHDIAIHPRENDLIIGTHGRSIWVFDEATPIQDLSKAVAAGDAFLFEVKRAMRHTSRFARFGGGDRAYVANVPPYGAPISYYLKSKPAGRMQLEILNDKGEVVREINNAPTEAGVNRVYWDLRVTPPRTRRTPPPQPTGGRGRGFSPGINALPGKYTARLTIGDKKLETPIEVTLEPALEPVRQNIVRGYALAVEGAEMNAALREAINALTSVEEQLRHVQGVVRARLEGAARTESEKAVEDALKHAGDLKAIADAPASSPQWASGPRMRSRLQSASGAMDGPTGPTKAQIEFLDEMKAEYRDFMTKANSFLTREIEGVNQVLKKHNAPIILSGGAINP